MKKILITGATGFIGNYVIQQLLFHNYKLIATSANEQKARKAWWFGKVEYVPFDLEHFDSSINYYSFFSKPDNIIHLAWEGLPHYKNEFHIKVNLPRHIAFLENLVLHGLRDITVTGTCLEYGMQEGCMREDMAAMPTTNYAKAKDALRRYLDGLQERLPFILKWIRLFYIYGKGQNPNSLFSQLDMALTKEDPVFNMSGGEQQRDYLSVEKVAAFIVSIATQQNVTGIINCSSNQPVAIKELVEAYLQKRNKKIHLNLGYYPYPDYEPMRFWGDNSKLKTILNNEQSNPAIH